MQIVPHNTECLSMKTKHEDYKFLSEGSKIRQYEINILLFHSWEITMLQQQVYSTYGKSEIYKKTEKKLRAII